ncbi:MAG TPA: hypothetical protein PKI61_02270 [bacterium]|nr:hypothetical protein [bacterium]HPT29978.1 hypothetical protein [bacterium]
MSKEDGQWVIQNTSEAINLFVEAVKNKRLPNKPLLLAEIGGPQLGIKALSGNRLICEAKKVFKANITSDFARWGLDKTGVATPETLIRVNEVIAIGTFLKIFCSLPGTWDQKWLSQDQIIEFCEGLPDWLRRPDKSAMMFLSKVDENKPINEDKPEDNLVVVVVVVRSGQLGAFVYCLGHNELGGEDRLCVVSPKRKLQKT